MNISDVKTSTSIDMISTTTAAVESNKINTSTIPQSQAEPQQNIYITSTAEVGWLYIYVQVLSI